MNRIGFHVAGVALGLALAACGSDSKASQSTTPIAPEPAVEPAPVAEAPPAPATPAVPAEPPAPTYVPGKWVWFELTTGDVEKAKAFYGGLLGWTIDEREMAGQKFNSISSGGKEIGLIQALPADAKQKKISAGWLGYISVPDVDAAVATATGAGAKVVLAATDLPDVGRFALLTDPAGATFGLVKAAKGDEPDAQPAVGNFIWIEHWSKNAKASTDAAAFYASVAGYQNQALKMGKSDYNLATASNMPRFGLTKAPKSSLGGRLVPYVHVADVDATVKAATGLKAKVVQKAADVPNVGRIAVLSDPQGALFAVMAPAPMGGAAPAATPEAAPATPAAPTTPAAPAAPAAPAEKK